jgi:NTP pyrophosphatase (non-canonical NTP hydrolase)
MKNPSFDLEEFSRLSITRNNDPAAFNCSEKPLSHYTSKMVEELGEICSAITKLERGWNIREKRKLLDKLRSRWDEKHPGMEHLFIEADDEELKRVWLALKTHDFQSECADLFIMMDLLMTRARKQFPISDEPIDLFGAVRKKFNDVSKELNVPQYTI